MTQNNFKQSLFFLEMGNYM